METQEKIQQPDTEPKARWHYLVVVALAAVIVFLNLGGKVMNDHEARLALTAKGMRGNAPWLIETDEDYDVPPQTRLNRLMVPVHNGRPRLDKTPLAYWAAAAVANLWSGHMTDFTARAYSAVSAVICAIVLLALGRRMLSRRAAFFGALVFLTCIPFQREGREARPEMLLCMLMTAAMASFYFGIHASTSRRRNAWMIFFWVLMGLANLSKQFVPVLLFWPLLVYLFWRQSRERFDDAKALGSLRAFMIATGVGLVAVLCMLHISAVNTAVIKLFSHGRGIYIVTAAAFGLPLIWYFLRSRGWRPLLKLLPTGIPGLLIMMALFVPWLIYMGYLFPNMTGQVMSEEVTERAAGLRSIKPSYYYVYILLKYILPWLAFLPGALAVALMNRFHRRRDGLVFLFAWFVGIFVLFTASAGKRQHYILPAMPALCLLIGFIAEDVFYHHKWIKNGLSRFVGGTYLPVAPVGIIALAILWLLYPRHQIYARMWPHMIVVLCIAGVPLVAAGIFARLNRFRAVMPLVVAGLAIIYLGYFVGVPKWDERAPIARYARQARDIIDKKNYDGMIYHWGKPQSKTVFYFGGDRLIPALEWRVGDKGIAEVREKLGREKAHEKWEKWIHDPQTAPWLMGYMNNPEKILELGYRPYHTVQSIQDKQLKFTLFHRSREPETRPATQKSEE